MTTVFLGLDEHTVVHIIKQSQQQEQLNFKAYEDIIKSHSFYNSKQFFRIPLFK